MRNKESKVGPFGLNSSVGEKDVSHDCMYKYSLEIKVNNPLNGRQASLLSLTVQFWAANSI